MGDGFLARPNQKERIGILLVELSKRDAKTIIWPLARALGEVQNGLVDYYHQILFRIAMEGKAVEVAEILAKVIGKKYEDSPHQDQQQSLLL